MLPLTAINIYIEDDNNLLSPFLSKHQISVKKFDKSTVINYNIFVAKTGCLQCQMHFSCMVERKLKTE